jgi:hypothetical protein
MINTGTVQETGQWSVGQVDRSLLLNDEEVMNFIIKGFHVIEPHQRPGLNEEIDTILSNMAQNPGNGIYDQVPLLKEIYGHPKVRAALASILGHDCTMNDHRHWHSRPPSPNSQGWHQDGNNQRHHQTICVLAMYYPQDVTIDMGPTVVLPGSHLRNCPTDQMATYGNIRGQVALTVKAGSIAITHYDIWHGGSVNRSNRTRHMLKFLFNRKSVPKTPSWNHNPETAPELAARKFTFEQPVPVGQSDNYKSRELKQQMWASMLGTDYVERKAVASWSDENTGKKRY